MKYVIKYFRNANDVNVDFMEANFCRFRRCTIVNDLGNTFKEICFEAISKFVSDRIRMKKKKRTSG